MPPPSASEAPGAALIARFRDDLARVVAHGSDGATLSDDARLVVAVSGGPDSMGLLALARAARPGRVLAATVDHQLRDGSAAEVAQVAAACRMLGVPHAALVPDAPIAGASPQAQAREARYALLLRWAAAQDSGFLLTAHHADDQAETLLMRLNRGSGVAGLSAIRPARWQDDVLIVRPVLGWRRKELSAVALDAGLPVTDDPTNTDPRHDRTRMRALLAATPELNPAALAASAGYLAEAEAVIRRAAELLWSERWHGEDRGFDVADEPRELRRRLVRRAIDAVRVQASIIRPVFGDATNVEPLLDALEAGRGAVQGGVKVTPSADGWRFVAAPPRRG